MIRVTETPHRGPPFTWTAHDRANFIDRCRGASMRCCEQIYLHTTVAELRDCYGADCEGAPEKLAEFLRRTTDEGAAVYFAHYLLDEEFSLTPVDEFEAYVAWLRADLRSLTIAE